MPTQLRFPTLILVFSLLLGFVADTMFVGRWIGLSAPLFVGAGLLVLFGFAHAEGRPPTRANVWLALAALVFAGLLAVRDAPLLVVLNVVAAYGLLMLLVANFRGLAFHRTSVAQAGIQAIVAAVLMIAAPFALVSCSIRSMPLRRANFGVLGPVTRGIALAAPVLLVFGGLLMAADGVFASYVWQTFNVSIPIDFEQLLSHGLIVGFVAWGCAGGIATAIAAEAANVLPAEGDTQRLTAHHAAMRFLGWVEGITVLVAVDLLFGVFMFVQGAYFFGGQDTLARTNMTYSDYARRGFFELVAVACLALALLWVLALVGKREPGRERRVFNAASVAMVVLVLGMLVSAFQRMWLYEQAYGFTELRLYTHSFMIWLAVVLLLFVVALLREQGRIFTFGSFATALMYLALLNLANPEALIVRANVARYAEMGELDTYYLSNLSADATPEIVAALNRVDSETRDALVSSLQWQRTNLAEAAAEQGWPAWSLARTRALAALEPIKDEE